MVKDNAQYIVRTPAGVEWPPLATGALVERARQGELTAGCDVRNVLVKNWKKASEWPVFAPHLLEYSKGGDLANAAAADPREREVAPARVYRQMAGQSGFLCTPGGWLLRLVAGVTDLALGMAVVVLVAALAAAGAAGDEQGAGAAFTLAVTVAGVLGGGAFLVGCNAQTPGQWFWGLMTVSADGRELFYGRAYWFVLCNLVLGWLTPLVQPLSPDRRGLAEWLTGARVIRIRLCHDAILKV